MILKAINLDIFLSEEHGVAVHLHNITAYILSVCLILMNCSEKDE